MSCEPSEERIAGEIGGEFSREVESHLRACPNCALLAEELENDRLSLAAAPPDAADADFGAMRRQIRSAIVRERRIRRFVPALVAAAAAIAIIVIHFGGPPTLKPPAIQRAQAQTSAPPVPTGLKPTHQVEGCCASSKAGRRPNGEGKLKHTPPVGTAPIDLALLRKVTGQQTAPETGSESPVEMQIATGNPDITIILLQAKEGSYE